MGYPRRGSLSTAVMILADYALVIERIAPVQEREMENLEFE
jgi:hypothetical protein